MIAEAYAAFGHPAVAPLKQLDDNQWLLELFHGPTLAFKDVAMQLLARLMDWSLARHHRRATIVGATSGDTGGAAIEAFRNSRHASIFILHPHGRVSDVQRRQMTTVLTPNVHNIAIEGNFDDCQAIVKALFNDHGLPRLGGPRRRQFHQLGPHHGPDRLLCDVCRRRSALPTAQVSFCVPTGNFGDIFAGFVAKRMGVPVDRLVIATNVNDILDRTLKTGRYDVQGRDGLVQPVDGYPGLEQFRTPALRGPWPRPQCCPPPDAEPLAVRRLHHRRRASWS